MYSRQEKQQLKKAFWTAFGLYMKPVPGAETEHPHWINYKTGLAHIFFHMFTQERTVQIGIEFRHASPQHRDTAMAHFISQQAFFQSVAGNGWMMDEAFVAEGGNTIATVYQSKNGLSVLNKEQWPEIISFLKPRIIALDAWWSFAKDDFAQIQYPQ